MSEREALRKQIAEDMARFPVEKIQHIPRGVIKADLDPNYTRHKTSRAKAIAKDQTRRRWNDGQKGIM